MYIFRMESFRNRVQYITERRITLRYMSSE